MGSLVRTANGKLLDMGKMVAQNGDVIAVTAGGLLMNARGDLLGSGGRVVKTREQLEEEYNALPKNPVKQVALSDRTFGRQIKADEALMIRGKAETAVLRGPIKEEELFAKESPTTSNTVQKKVTQKRILVEDQEEKKIEKKSEVKKTEAKTI